METGNGNWFGSVDVHKYRMLVMLMNLGIIKAVFHGDEFDENGKVTVYVEF